MSGIWAVVPVKELVGAKQRLAGFLSPEERYRLAVTMLDEVLDALAGARGLGGVALVTLDPHATSVAARHGWRVITAGARDGHTGSVDAGRRILAAEGVSGILTLPGDIPAATSAEIDAVLAAHPPGAAFTIVPAHDEQGSNTVIVSPPLAVTLRFGENSYFPHLDAARAAGIEPTIVHKAGIAMDIDHPGDIAMFLGLGLSVGTRTRAVLEEMGVSERLKASG